MPIIRDSRFHLILMFFLFLSPQSLAKEFRYPALKNEIIDQTSPETIEEHLRELRIYSTTDNDAMKDVIKDFQKRYPLMMVKYHEMQSLELYKRIITDNINNVQSADIAISSAMDLQMKLANDGYARRVDVNFDKDLPNWAVWRNEVFGTTLEPCVIIYHKPYFTDKPLPQNRSDLISFLETNRFALYGKVATYDIEKSGLGYMFLTRDDSQFSGTWDLVRALGLSGVKLFSQSSKIIDGVSSGKLKLGYNVLGSYAISQLADNPDLGVILPEDYTILFSRLALIPKAAASADAGRLFLEYLLSERGQQQISTKAQLNAIHPDVKSPHQLLNSLHTENSSLRPIKVGPGLLVYLDQLKRLKILERWKKTLQIQ